MENTTMQHKYDEYKNNALYTSHLDELSILYRVMGFNSFIKYIEAEILHKHIQLYSNIYTQSEFKVFSDYIKLYSFLIEYYTDLYKSYGITYSYSNTVNDTNDLSYGDNSTSISTTFSYPKPKHVLND